MTTTAELSELAAHIEGKLSDAGVETHIAYGELTVVSPASAIVDVMRFLRDDKKCDFGQLIDVCGADYPERAARFEVVYHLLSMTKNRRVRCKVALAEGEMVSSIIDIFDNANWYERETFDMYGIVFSGHPDLRRILTDYGFEGYPLRKDFPLTGHVEVRYDDDVKKVVYEPVRLVQEFRDFDFESPWEGARTLLPGDEKAASSAGEE
jgi:NADH-quinone oxidoreductase subunit C